jgi:hypothetical protein
VSVVDLHPENLLDKEIRGELDEGDRERLNAHLAQCATCRLERELRAGFALELSRGSVPPEIAGLVDTLARRSVAPPSPAPPRTRRMKLVFLAAAATLTLVAGAFAATEGGRRTLAPLFGREGPTTTYREAAQATANPALRAAPVAPMAAPPPAASADPSPAVVEASVPPGPSPAPAALPQPAPAAAPDSPASLFGAEAEARRRGDTARMLELHARLAARYPSSHEAQVSRLMVARLLLDRGDAAGALSGFDAYLRAGSGELREDALAGRATALDRLGRTDEGRRAWMALLDQCPNTAYGAHARSRVEATGGN